MSPFTYVSLTTLSPISFLGYSTIITVFIMVSRFFLKTFPVHHLALRLCFRFWLNSLISIMLYFSRYFIFLIIVDKFQPHHLVNYPSCIMRTSSYVTFIGGPLVGHLQIKMRSVADFTTALTHWLATIFFDDLQYTRTFVPRYSFFRSSMWGSTALIILSNSWVNSLYVWAYRNSLDTILGGKPTIDGEYPGWVGTNSSSWTHSICSSWTTLFWLSPMVSPLYLLSVVDRRQP